MNTAGEAPDTSVGPVLSEEQAHEILRRLRRDATLFGEGASAYEAGLEDALRALRGTHASTRDPSGAR